MTTFTSRTWSLASKILRFERPRFGICMGFTPYNETSVWTYLPFPATPFRVTIRELIVSVNTSALLAIYPQRVLPSAVPLQCHYKLPRRGTSGAHDELASTMVSGYRLCRSVASENHRSVHIRFVRPAKFSKVPRLPPTTLNHCLLPTPVIGYHSAYDDGICIVDGAQDLYQLQA
jgi:hypothetical protein